MGLNIPHLPKYNQHAPEPEFISKDTLTTFAMPTLRWLEIKGLKAGTDVESKVALVVNFYLWSMSAVMGK